MMMQRLAVGVSISLAGLFLAQACSLGEGQTPACDPTAEAGTDSACQQLEQCDDGKGGIAMGNEPCCLRRASYEFATCADVEEPDDFRPQCVDVPMGLDCSLPKGERDPRCCCRGSQDLFDLCMTQGLTSTTTGAGGAGGSGGAIGSGGAGGSGGATGSGGASGGAGGN